MREKRKTRQLYYAKLITGKTKGTLVPYFSTLKVLFLSTHEKKLLKLVSAIFLKFMIHLI